MMEHFRLLKEEIGTSWAMTLLVNGWDHYVESFFG